MLGPWARRGSSSLVKVGGDGCLLASLSGCRQRRARSRQDLSGDLCAGTGLPGPGCWRFSRSRCHVPVRRQPHPAGNAGRSAATCVDARRRVLVDAGGRLPLTQADHSRRRKWPTPVDASGRLLPAHPPARRLETERGATRARWWWRRVAPPTISCQRMRSGGPPPATTAARHGPGPKGGQGASRSRTQPPAASSR